MTDFKQWDGFEGRIWKEEVNTRDFIQKNYTPYDGDESFLAGPTDATNKLWGALQKLLEGRACQAGGVLDMETEVVSGHDRIRPRLHRPPEGLEKVVGLQTDKPLEARLHALRRHPAWLSRPARPTAIRSTREELHEIFHQVHRKTHNAGCV